MNELFYIFSSYFEQHYSWGIKKGKREYLNNSMTRNLMKQLFKYLEMEIEIPRIRIGKKQTIETLINEEMLLLAKFLRNAQELTPHDKLRLMLRGARAHK